MRAYLTARSAIVAVSALLLAALCVAVGLSASLQSKLPSVATSAFPWNGKALAAQADAAFQSGIKSGRGDRGEALARRALRADPSLAAAVRVIAFAQERRAGAALSKERILHAATLSRRDLPTNVWLIEDAVSREDVPGALRSFDMALRTSQLAAPLLFPILNNALSDERLVAPTADLLAARPRWRDSFLAQLVTDAPVQSAAALVSALQTRSSAPADDYQQSIMMRLADAGDHDRAWRIYTSGYFRKGERPPLIRAGRFSPPIDRPSRPFGWGFVEDPDKGIDYVRGAAAAPGIDLYATDSASGEVARQLLRMPPGRYRLLSTFEVTDGSAPMAPRWTVACGTRVTRVLGGVRLWSETGRASRAQAELIVPRDCPTQWIFLVVPGGRPAGSLGLRVNSVSLAPLPNGAS